MKAPDKPKFASKSGTKWSPRELKYLEDHYGKKSVTAIARRLGRTVDGVRAKAAEIRRKNKSLTIKKKSFASSKSKKKTFSKKKAAPKLKKRGRRTEGTGPRKR